MLHGDTAVSHDLLEVCLCVFHGSAGLNALWFVWVCGLLLWKDSVPRFAARLDCVVHASVSLNLFVKFTCKSFLIGHSLESLQHLCLALIKGFFSSTLLVSPVVIFLLPSLPSLTQIKPSHVMTGGG